MIAAAGVSGGKIYTSADSGVSWTLRDPAGANANWESIASSADGVKLVACARSGKIYTSNDSGVNWTARDPVGVNADWYSVASSLDVRTQPK